MTEPSSRACCPSCGAVQSMAWLCSGCCSAVETMLAAAPALIEQLDVAASKQVKIGDGGSRARTQDKEDDGNDAGLAHTRSPVNWGAVAVRDALLVELALWGDDINEIRRHPKAAEIVAGIGMVVKNAYQAIDRMRERQYLGVCMYEEDGAICHAEVWAGPGAREVTCTQCEVTHPVAERRAWLMKKAKDVLATVKEASSYMGEVGHIHVTEASIRGYIHRKRISYRPNSNLIRIGDLLAVVMDESEKRSA